MTKQLVLPFCEMMASYACNLSCTGCTNYSDYNTKGIVTWRQAKEWVVPWLDRVSIPDIGIIGGEPLLNSEIDQWIIGLRNLLPSSQIRFTTNGVLLTKKKHILQTISDAGNAVIKISVHQPQDFYTQEILNCVFGFTSWKPIVEHGINRWVGPNNVKLQINFPEKFIKTYKGSFKNMLPHSNNPEESFKICVQKQCPLLLDGALYKCSSIALLTRVLDDWAISDRDPWQPYLDYQGILPDCSARDLENFLYNFGKPENICSMCPTEHEQDDIVLHNTKSVMSKVEWINKNK
jgi:hypothetical protein